MKNKKEQKNTNKNHFDKGQIFVKVMAGFLALMMLLAAGATLIFSLLG